MKKYFYALILFLLCSNTQNVDEYNSEIFLGNWTQIKNYYKGSSGHTSNIGYGELEIHFVNNSKWFQYFNQSDSIECTTWDYFVRNDSLMRSLDNLNFYYVGKISKSEDTLIIDKDYLTLWFVPYDSDELPENWNKNIVYKN